MASTKVQRIMTQPINLIFRFLQSKARIQIWLFEQKDLRIEGRIIGFDEYMNLVLDDAEEVNVKKNTRKSLGRILLKGDNITLMMNTDSQSGDRFEQVAKSLTNLLLVLAVLRQAEFDKISQPLAEAMRWEVREGEECDGEREGKEPPPSANREGF
ncbi:hypothetical protein Ancab_012594 [Ancistrocladus abbreviatus]